MHRAVETSIEPVRITGTCATHEGARARKNEDALGFFEDASAAIAVLSSGLGPSRSGRDASDLVVQTCKQVFRGRSTAILDELAETWWQGEHGPAARRPFSSLPIKDRVELRDHVERLLAQRKPDSMGDVAVLEAETNSVLAIPQHVLDRANREIERQGDRSSLWRGLWAASACVLFAAGRASVARAPDPRAAVGAETRVYRVRTGIEQLEPGLVPIARGERFLLASEGLWRALPVEELRDAVRTHGAGAAAHLVERARHGDANVSAISIEVVKA
jgi:hypothetical protein